MEDLKGWGKRVQLDDRFEEGRSAMVRSVRRAWAYILIYTFMNIRQRLCSLTRLYVEIKLLNIRGAIVQYDK